MSTMDDAIASVCIITNIQVYFILIQFILWMIFGFSLSIFQNNPIYIIGQNNGGVNYHQPVTIKNTLWGSTIFLIWLITLFLYPIYLALLMSEARSIMQYCTPNHIFYSYFNK